MKKTMRFLSMAALALVGAVMTGCSNDDNIINESQQPAGNVVTLTTTVSLDDGAATRALGVDFDNKKATKTFAVGDQIAVDYEDTYGYKYKVESMALTDGDISADGKSATFTVTLTDPRPATKVRYIYPAAMTGNYALTYTELDNDEYTIDFTRLAMQDGTLATLGRSLDLAVFDGYLTSEAKLPATAPMTNRLAILALTLKDDKGTPETTDDQDITSTITGLTVCDGTNNYNITRSAAAGPIYLAVPPKSGADITVTATDGSKLYKKSLTSKTYDASNFYNISWRMTEGITTTINLASITTDTEIPNGALVTGTLGNQVKISIAAGAIVKLDNVSINADGAYTYPNAGITCLGDATIILEAGSTNTVKGFDDNYPGIFVNDGKTLTISGTGTLNASSNGYGAGIGGGSYTINHFCGNIIIAGGTINATGGQYCAGIGSGKGYPCGDITITGGKVTAVGGLNGAGIGAGYGDGGALATCGNITITGGTVNATGGQMSAGIGTGDQMSQCGNIYISGGEVTALGGTYAGEGGAGIGAGHAGDCDINQCGDIYITGGTITATGGYHSAGIGTGSGGSHATTCGDITITNTVTKVTATKGTYAPYSIGKGYGSNVVCGTVTIGDGANVIQN